MLYPFFFFILPIKKVFCLLLIHLCAATSALHENWSFNASFNFKNHQNPHGVLSRLDRRCVTSLDFIQAFLCMCNTIFCSHEAKQKFSSNLALSDFWLFSKVLKSCWKFVIFHLMPNFKLLYKIGSKVK